MAKFQNISSVKQIFYKDDGEKIVVEPGELVDEAKLGFTPPADSFQKESVLSKIFTRKKDVTRKLPAIESITATNGPDSRAIAEELNQIMQNASPSVAAAIAYMAKNGGLLPEAIQDRNNPMKVSQPARSMPHKERIQAGDNEMVTGQQLPPDQGSNIQTIPIQHYDPAERLLDEPVVLPVQPPPPLKTESKEDKKPKKFKR